LVTVKVVYEDSGKPAENKKVALYLSRFLASGVTDTVRTDSRGEAHFEEIEPCDGEIYVDGSTEFKGRLSGRMVVYI
jgi:hypothetical protein